MSKTQPIARCGYFEYARITEKFEMIIPGDKATLFGLEGSVKQHKEFSETGRVHDEDESKAS